MAIETVVISKKQYDVLIQNQNMLANLIAAGVDNWEGYDEAVGEGESEEEIYG